MASGALCSCLSSSSIFSNSILLCIPQCIKSSILLIKTLLPTIHHLICHFESISMIRFLYLYSMGLNKFQYCSADHKDDVQYCCFKSNKVFCQNCWFRDGHPFRCYSSRCGHFEKLAHLVIDKNLQMKVMHHLSQMSSCRQQYQKFYRRIYQLKQIITMSVKQDLENKLPLFLWSTAIQMLNKKNTHSDDIIFEEGTCLDMLKIIKNKNSKKSENLERAVDEFEKMNHLFTGMKNRNEKKSYKGDMNREIEQCIEFYNNQAGTMICNLKGSIKNHMQDQVKKILQKFDPNIDYKGVKFNNKFNFSNSQGYRTKDLISEIFVEMDSCGRSYNGMNLQITKLQQSPQTLLQSAKCILKQKIFKTFHSIKEMKSTYPYKYGYIMSTCLSPDVEYEKTVLKMQKMAIKGIDKGSQNPFLNSIHVVVMGPQLIIIEFKNYPTNSAQIYIYGAKQERKEVINGLIKDMVSDNKTMNSSTIQLKKTIKEHQFQNQITTVGRVYAYFELVYQHLFMSKDERGDFQGCKYVQARGSKRFAQIVTKWQQTSEVQLQIQVHLDSILPLFI